MLAKHGTWPPLKNISFHCVRIGPLCSREKQRSSCKARSISQGNSGSPAQGDRRTRRRLFGITFDAIAVRDQCTVPTELSNDISTSSTLSKSSLPPAPYSSPCSHSQPDQASSKALWFLLDQPCTPRSLQQLSLPPPPPMHTYLHRWPSSARCDKCCPSRTCSTIRGTHTSHAGDLRRCGCKLL